MYLSITSISACASSKQGVSSILSAASSLLITVAKLYSGTLLLLLLLLLFALAAVVPFCIVKDTQSDSSSMNVAVVGCQQVTRKQERTRAAIAYTANCTLPLQNLLHQLHWHCFFF
jgi:hypothetical protein